MPTAQITKTLSIAGANSVQSTVARIGESSQVWGGSDAPITLNTAFTVTDFSKSDNDTATMNLPAGHGQVDGKFDIFWTESGVNKNRYNMDGTIVTNALTLDGGSGDNFPVAPTTPVVCKPKTVSAAIDGDAVSIFWAALQFTSASAIGRGHVLFEESDTTEVGTIDIPAAQNAIALADYDIEAGVTNPLAGELIAAAKVSHNDPTYTPTFLLAVLTEDATP
jgi:hypothetical protein